ncbi:hypothetical protein [Xanthomonas campestris]|uniref:hypothetical protein n=1 Tax=Xanthomonas campestris TaxID=339 RepID=UPI000CB5DF9E|nr:hypothetical protein [Xanthomonas campestris]MCD0261685.1 hypothetical protein [Xanthomonas campestris pv. campestris]MCD0269940.1 hypothetical protein [Xanthomonas campestris pv. campestris]PJR22786.1 hypothetical protein ASJ34_18195 [Xanthomonas campestris pv. campestris]
MPLTSKNDQLGALDVVASERSVGEIVQDLHKKWENVGRLVPERATVGDRVLFRLAKALFQDMIVVAEGLPEDDLVCEQYDQLQRRYLLSDAEGRRSLVSAIRHQHLMQPVQESEEVMPQTALVRVSGAAYVPLTLRVLLPPVSLEAHRQELRLNLVQGTERTFGFLPMADVLEYRKRTHSLVALAPLHRWSRNPGQAVQVTYGDWFCADGYGRALYAAAVSGLVVRRGETANGMGGVSPMFALTRAGRSWLLRQPGLAEAFDHFNGIENSTAWIDANGQGIAFDTNTGAILGSLSEVDDSTAPTHVDLDQCPEPPVAWRAYDYEGLTLHNEDGAYSAPDIGTVRPV